MRPKVSVIIPCRNEAGRLPETLASIHAKENQCEVIVVAPNSEDDSIAVAISLGARVVIAGRAHRAAQMNHGATIAEAGLLLFLHADTRLNPRSVAQALEAVSKEGVVGGAFHRRFDSPSPFLALTCLLAGWRGELAGWHFGDQAIFARAEAFREIGGFRDMEVFEDLDFSRRLKTLGHVKTIRPPILSSARRFDLDGPFVRTWKDLQLTVGFLLGRGVKSPARRNSPVANREVAERP